MSAPQLTAYVQGQGAVSADELNTFIQSCDNFTQLRALTGLPGMQVYARGAVTPGDNGQGEFYWLASSTAPDNGLTVIRPSGTATGAWIRLGGSLTIGDLVVLDTVAALQGTIILPSVSSVELLGYYFVGDLGAQTLIRSATAGPGPGKIQSANGQWWLLSVAQVFVEMFGTKGDGVTDDTTAVQNALTFCEASGQTLFFSPKTYACGTLTANNVTLVGSGQWGYDQTVNYSIETPSYAGQISIIQNYGTVNQPVFTSADGINAYNMVFRSYGTPTAGSRPLFTVASSQCTFDKILFEGLTSLGANNAAAWGNWTMFNCQTVLIQGDVFYGVCVDSIIIGNRFTSTNGNVFNLTGGAGFITISGNRFEYTGGTHISDYQGRENTIVGNVFDRSYGVAVQLIDKTGAQSITGNTFFRNGFTNSGADVAHINVQACTSKVSITGNAFLAGQQDDGSGPLTPQFVLALTSQLGLVSYQGNADDGGYASLPFIDPADNSALIEADGVRASAAGANTGADQLAAILANVGANCLPGAVVQIAENRALNSYDTVANTASVTLRNISTSAVTVDATNGNIFSLKDNLIIGTCTYACNGGMQYSNVAPNGYQQNGRFAVGVMIFNSAPASGDPMGWVTTTAGSPDTITALANLA